MKINTSNHKVKKLITDHLTRDIMIHKISNIERILPIGFKLFNFSKELEKLGYEIESIEIKIKRNNHEKNNN
jgi:hypothetical protein